MNTDKPQVGIIMGSDSDLAVMSEAAQILDEFSISYELTIVSAHRTPERMVTYARSAVERGIKVLIAGAGGAAHLPGMVASLTTLPVIGVPVKGKYLEGLDSLLSIVQMPPSIPVATMAINGGKNAGLFAVKILSVSDDELVKKVGSYMQNIGEMVQKKAGKLEKVGWREYIDSKKS
ncbi:5-(carboxyamino)imidazole ribonucleotide mutase [soil metagenome]